MMYECLAGQMPFTGDSPLGLLIKHVQEPPPPLRALAPDVPVALEQVVMRLLEKRPADRYQTAIEVKEALMKAVETSKVE
jgi:serine/threonine-protein kinase